MLASVTPVGLEPTQLALGELELTPLDHSGTVSWPLSGAAAILQTHYTSSVIECFLANVITFWHIADTFGTFTRISPPYLSPPNANKGFVSFVEINFCRELHRFHVTGLEMLPPKSVIHFVFGRF